MVSRSLCVIASQSEQRRHAASPAPSRAGKNSGGVGDAGGQKQNGGQLSSDKTNFFKKIQAIFP